jgi:hypothetical protein
MPAVQADRGAAETMMASSPGARGGLYAEIDSQLAVWRTAAAAGDSCIRAWLSPPRLPGLGGIARAGHAFLPLVGALVSPGL